jgi:hypothetical protein
MAIFNSYFDNQRVNDRHKQGNMVHVVHDPLFIQLPGIYLEDHPRNWC